LVVVFHCLVLGGQDACHGTAGREMGGGYVLSSGMNGMRLRLASVRLLATLSQVCCSVLQRVAACCSEHLSDCSPPFLSVSRCSIVCCSALKCDASSCSIACHPFSGVSQLGILCCSAV